MTAFTHQFTLVAAHLAHSLASAGVPDGITELTSLRSPRFVTTSRPPARYSPLNGRLRVSRT